MNAWLFKSDPDDYSAADLERDGRTTWDGVSNALALRHLRSARAGDAVALYHTGDEKAVVALARVVAVTGAGAKAAEVESGVEIAFDRWLPRPVALSDLKRDAAFADSPLVKISRLSILPLNDAQWRRILTLAGASARGSR